MTARKPSAVTTQKSGSRCQEILVTKRNLLLAQQIGTAGKLS